MLLPLDHGCYKVATYENGTMDGRQFRFYLQGNGLISTRLRRKVGQECDG